MPSIPKAEAVERLARAAEEASADDLVEIYTELFPAKSPPDVLGSNAAEVATMLALQIRSKVEPEEIVDLWNVVFPADRGVYYDEEDEALRFNERDVRYAEQ
jgi:hypothetical protein